MAQGNELRAGLHLTGPAAGQCHEGRRKGRHGVRHVTTKLLGLGLVTGLAATALFGASVHRPAGVAADSPSYARPLCNRVAATNPAKAAALCPTASSSSAPPSLAPTDSPADECGPWSDPTTPGTAAAAIQSAHGEIRNCLRVGASWVIATLGGFGKTGVIAIYRCANAACLDGQTAHGYAGWKFIHSPRSGGAIVLGLDPRYKDTLIIDDAGTQLDFNVDTGAFFSNTVQSEVK